MDRLGLNISTALENLCKNNGKCAADLQGLLAKQIWSPADRANLLDILSRQIVQPSCTVDVGRAFRALLLELLVRAQKDVKPASKIQWINHQKFCVALSNIVTFSDQVAGFALEYLGQNEPFFKEERYGGEEPEPKKSKKSKKKAPSKKDLLHSVYRLVCHLGAKLRNIWDWSDLLTFLNDDDLDVRWFSVQSIVRLAGLSTSQTRIFLGQHFSQKQYKDLVVRWDGSSVMAKEKALLLCNPVLPTEGTEKGDLITHTMRGVLDADLCQDVVSVCGVLLPKVAQTTVSNQESEFEMLTLVGSTQRNLYSLGLAVAAGSAVLLEGPVGCGKTSLVEHMAHVTGRSNTSQLMKVQLGDQTDSKALLGTYRCTDVPGEFVWQPGSLTRAVTEGHWILLEDLDYAPMDVISVLVPLLQGGTLSLPGHGDNIKAHPSFRLFASQRLLGAGSGWYKQHNVGSGMLERMWTKISVEPMSRTELQQVIITRHPQLATSVDRLLDIYFLLSAGRHELSSDNMETDSEGDMGKFLARDGRLISTRDLMKWCSRISSDFDVTGSSTGIMVFQEALDVFCACLAKPDRRLPLAEAIGTKLNINKVKSEYYCTKYKPNIEITVTNFTVGRVSLERQHQEVASLQRGESSSFAFTRQSVSLLERVAVCVAKCEPVLLVGETGTGKTSSVQYLAQQMGHKLQVINMNQQSDSTDLLGGFKPVDLRIIIAPFREEFEMLFCKTFSRKQNSRFLGHLQECFSKRRWSDLLKLIEHTQKSAITKFQQDTEMGKSWLKIGQRVMQLKAQVRQIQNTLAFTFIEGTLVKALKRGDWVLLDEINLAAAETLECLSGLLESQQGSIVLMERGDTEPIVRHPNFRLFACMNPATDVGKKDLPPGVRNRFTELYVDELEDVSDLKVLVAEYLKGLSLTAGQIDGVVKFYLHVRSEAMKKLTDGTGHRPHYSLRSLCRALRQAATNAYGGVLRSLYEGFSLSFLTELDRSSHLVVEGLICQHVVGRSNIKGILKHSLPEPPGGKHLPFEGYWVAMGTKEAAVPEEYVLTPSVRANLRDLARVTAAGRYPVLLQGETSVGKTSMITYLAAASGNVCVRINNHEHTDIQEYIGCYAADDTGKLMFKEGVLVEAMRKGYWIILDELNLAPTDVLEALNRLLDDNRELFIPETQETIKAHPRFLLFATQNPPGQYGGRKVLSRAFRNRFVELHFDEIPPGELETILHQRCQMPLSYCKRLVAILLELQTRRRGSGVFAGKQGFITLRDLFRWAERYKRASYETKAKFFDWDQQLADNGYMLLAGRVRKPEECQVIQEVIEKHLRRKVDPALLFTLSDSTSPTTAPLLKEITVTPPGGFGHVVWTYGMRRMAVLVGQALKFGEPVLLVGETGCGKTTICQLFSSIYNQQLHSVNCHLHTETSDFLGGLRPVRLRDQDSEDNKKLFEWCDGPLVAAMKSGDMFLIDEISLADDSVLERLNSVLEPERTLLLAEKGGGDGDQNEVDIIVADGMFKVVATMNPGGDYGKKELSPALRNRFTEIWCPQGTERQDLVGIIEHNLIPGVHLCNQQDGSSGIGSAIMDFVEWFANNEIGRRCTVSIRDLLSWVHFINATAEGVTADMEVEDRQHLEAPLAYVHGACLVFLDGLGSGVTSSGAFDPAKARRDCLTYLLDQVSKITGQTHTYGDMGLLSEKIKGNTEGATEIKGLMPVCDEHSFGIPPFYIPRGNNLDSNEGQYALNAPTTSMNAQRVLRALQLSRPILLEGSPGVGKTSLVSAIAKASGHELVRINLSEQTDVSDLFGADLPVEGGEGGQFAWRDGPLLRALKAGHWVVLDELNLASQSVLEGLNACLDHRAEVFVPELGMTFTVQHEKTRLFACQNPLNQGGGRKGLPRSFLNRFTQVYVEPLSPDDLVFITQTVYPNLPEDVINSMVMFNEQIHTETVEEKVWGIKGSPWEFNLRDIFRWCDLLVVNQKVAGEWDPREYLGIVYSDRMRNVTDKEQVFYLYDKMAATQLPICTQMEVMSEVNSNSSLLSEMDLQEDVCENKDTIKKGRKDVGNFYMTSKVLQVGHSFLSRKDVVSYEDVKSLAMLHHCFPTLESLIMCVNMNWMAILVGPSSSGKTSLVEMLAHLGGYTLHVLPMNSSMDTTELLGGFEQADLGRHVEELSNRIETILHQATTLLLLTNHNAANSQLRDLTNPNSAISKVQTLMQQWNKFKKLHPAGEEMVTSVELEHMQRRLTVLTDTMKMLQNSLTHLPAEDERIKSMVSELKCGFECLKKLEVQVGSKKSANQGGKFEWVDSLLVQALTQGHWLLIDNVNLCSPSVLDRLNALLEPNGVLTINERGVIDGQIPSITPHPHFRLFLAMDPQYGEISRAMRNRGIEIYVLGEEDGEGYSNFDLKQMLSGLGITGRMPCEALMGIYRDLREALMGHEKPAITDMLHAARLAHQQMDRGTDLKGALHMACWDVYVRPQRNNHTRNIMKDVISSCLSDLSLNDLEQKEQRSSILDLALWPDGVPVLCDLASDVTMATVKRFSASLLYHTNLVALKLGQRSQMPLTFQELQGAGQLDNLDLDLDRLHSEVQVSLGMTLEKASMQNWAVMGQWLHQTVGSRMPNSCSSPPHHLKSLLIQGLAKVTKTMLKAMFNCPLIEKVKERLQQIAASQDDVEMLQEMPLDMRWNTSVMKRMQISARARGSEAYDLYQDALQHLTQLANQIKIVGQIAQRQVLYLEEVSKPRKSKSSHTRSLLQLSHAFHTGEVMVTNLPYPWVMHIFPFLSTLMEELAIQWASDRQLCNSNYHQACKALFWLDRFVEACREPFHAKQRDTVKAELNLIWMQLCGENAHLHHLLTTQHIRNSQLQSVVNQLCLSELGQSTQKAWQIYKVLVGTMSPAPYIREDVARAHIQILNLLEEADLHANTGAVQEARELGKVRFAAEARSEVVTIVLRAMAQLRQSDQTTDIGFCQEVIANLEEALQVYRLGPQAMMMEVTDNTDQQSQQTHVPIDVNQVHLWPLYDVLILKSHLVLVANQQAVQIKEQCDSVDFINSVERTLESFMNFVTQKSTQQVSALVPHKVFQQGLGGQGLVSELILSVLSNLRKNTATNLVDKWLSWQPMTEQSEYTDKYAVSMSSYSHHSSVLSHIAFSLLVNTQNVTNKSASGEMWLPSNISLGCYKEKVKQLDTVSRQLWVHHQHLASKQWSTRMCSLQLIKACSARLLHAIRPWLNLELLGGEGLTSDYADLVSRVTSPDLLAADQDWHLLSKVVQSEDISELVPHVVMESWVESLRSIATEGEEHEEGWTDEVYRLGKVWLHTGWVQMCLFLPQPPVDPAHLHAFQLHNYTQQLSQVEFEIQGQEEWSRVIEGHDLNLSDPKSDLHPHVSHLVIKRAYLQKQVENLSHQVAFRPAPSQYPMLLQEVGQFHTSLASTERVSELASKIREMYEGNNNSTGGSTVLAEARSWYKTGQEFVARLMSQYPLYKDLLVPFVEGISQMMHGMEQMAFALDTKLSREVLIPPSLHSDQMSSLEGLMQTLVCLPPVGHREGESMQGGCLRLADSMLGDRCLGLLQHLLQQEQDSQTEDAKVIIPRLLRSALLQVQNHALITGSLGGSTLPVLSQLFHLYVTSWHAAEEERKRKEQEEESLYHFRARSHGDDLTEEQRDQIEIKQTFPSFEQDFEDIKVGYTLDDKPKSEVPDIPMPDEEDATTPWKMSEKEMGQISQVHRKLFQTLARAEWLTTHRENNHPDEKRTKKARKGKEEKKDVEDYIEKENELDGKFNLVEPLLYSYQVAAKVHTQIFHMTSSEVDESLLPGHLVVSGVLQQSVNQDKVFKVSSEEKPYDIYQDSNVPEAVQCRPLLEEFRTKVETLLAEWPDHPTLKQLTMVIDRIMAFPVTNPLMKFVTGLEVLMHKAQEWESNAARHVSLSVHTEAVTQMVIQWRKLELRCWSSCLDTAAWKHRQRAAKWWFHLYQLIQSYLQPPMDDEKDETSVQSLVKALQQFLEGATVGEYKARLDLVYAFHCQVITMETSNKQEELVGLLWNVHQYYDQFSSKVANHLAQQRKPIDNELKGYVKIAKWNDINFWSVKIAVEKTHQTLHKQIKAFQVVLQQPVAPLLTDTGTEWSAPSGGGDETLVGSVGAVDVHQFIGPQEVIPTIATLLVGEASIQHRLPSLYSKMRRHITGLLQRLPYPSLVSGLDHFTADIIDTVHHLQSVDVSTMEDKDKRKSEVKLLQQRKRKALADLFKHLQLLGLSYRKGLMSLKNETADSSQAMLAPPLEVSAALSHTSNQSGDEETCRVWQACSMYHLRCVSRRALFHLATHTPSQELGTANIDRCKGFSEDLMNISHHQRTALNNLTHNFIKFRGILDNIRHMTEHSGEDDLSVLPDQKIVKEWLSRLKTMYDDALLCLEEAALLLRCCPQNPKGDTSCLSPVSPQLSTVATMVQQDPSWAQKLASVKAMKVQLMEKKRIIDSYENGQQIISHVFTFSDINALEECAKQFVYLSKGPLCELLGEGHVPQSLPHHACFQPLLHIRTMAKTYSAIYPHHYDLEAHKGHQQEEINADEFDSLQSSTDQLVKQVLLAVQTLMKLTEGHSEGAKTDEDKEDDEILDKHLTDHLQASVLRHISATNLQTISSLLGEILHKIVSYSSDRGRCGLTIKACHMLRHCIPLLSQYAGLVQYLLTIAIASHRATAKLLSVLLAIFSELAQKGFCLPAEYADEMEGEGASQFEDIQGGGMGEGQGAKDVSDQIESEDQLEDAHQEGKEKQEEDPSQQPDLEEEDNAIEMSNEFDGKMHDLEAKDGDENESDSENEMDENELEKEMGDLEEKDADKLDEQIWGSDDEEEKDEKEKEEEGPGAGAESEANLVAKDDNPDQSENKDNKQPQKEDQDDGDNEDKKPNEIEDVDEREYDENEHDPHYGDNPPPEEPENMDLPENLNLDEGMEEDEKEKEEQQEDNPHDLDKMADSGITEEESKDESENKDEEDMDTEEQGQREEESQAEQQQDNVGEDDQQMEQQEENLNDEDCKEGDKDEKEREENGTEEEEGKPDGNQGFEPQVEESEKQEDDDAEGAPDEALRTEHSTANVQQSLNAKDATAGDNQEQETEGVGLAETDQQEGHQGDDSTTVTTLTSDPQQQPSKSQLKPGKSDTSRTLGDVDEKVHKKLKTVDTPEDKRGDEDKEKHEQQESNLYEHVKDSQSSYDRQTLDVATAEQQQEQSVPNVDDVDNEDQDLQGDDNINPNDEDKAPEQSEVETLPFTKLKPSGDKGEKPGEGEEEETEVGMEWESEVENNQQEEVEKAELPATSIHTDVAKLHYTPGELDIEKLREVLEQELHTWSHPKQESLEEERAAQKAWHQYEALTSSLSQELCEQLRLVLEPTQASKLRGDYRTGKRLNMRKVIPYIASQFRKDKIWLRRTKPSKRQYQVMVAVDDSSSMADNHSKQLAFESLATISNALALLEVGEISICSFGEHVKMLHPFHEQFSSHSGAHILKQFTFEQKKTKIAQLLDHAIASMVGAQRRQQGVQGHPETSQLLLMVSDGRGLFLEGMEVVKAAVRRAREAKVFLVFVIIDNPQNKDSILDIKVPVFKKAGQLPEIKSYMDEFPFPFYVILRDINSLPHTLGDALRQWFELVTAADK